MSIFDKYNSSLKLNVDLRRKTFEDQTGNYTQSDTKTGYWTNQGFRQDGGDSFRYNNSFAYGQALTAEWYGIPAESADMRAFCKGVNVLSIRLRVTTNAVSCYLAATGSLGSATGATYKVNEPLHIIITYDGTTTKCFVDGVLYLSDGTASGNLAAYTNTDIGSLNSAVERFEGTHILYREWNATMTDADAAKLYEEALAGGTINATPKSTILPEATFDQSASQLKLGMNIIGGTVYDTSGNGNDGTISDVYSTKGIFGNALIIDGADSSINCGSDTTIDDVFDGGGTFSAWVYPRSDGEANTGRLADKTRYAFYISGEVSGFCKIVILYGFDGGTGAWDTTNLELALNTWSHIVITYDNGSIENDPVIYVNGASVSVNEITKPIGTRISDAASTLFIGNNSAKTTTFDGAMDQIQLYNSAATAPEVLELYNLGENKIDICRRGIEWEQSTGNVTDGYIGNSGFEVTSGTWDITAPAQYGTKALRSVVSGVASIKSPYAFGTWEFDLYKVLDNSELRVLLMSSASALVTDASVDGYQFRLNSSERVAFSRIDTGTDTALGYSASDYIALSAWYTIRITRTTAGVFTMYIKGGAYTSWTQVDVSGGGGTNPVTDTTHTASTYFVVDADGGNDTIANIKYWPTVKNPT
jgi:hypothetical protein